MYEIHGTNMMPAKPLTNPVVAELYLNALKNLNVNHIRFFPWKDFEINVHVQELEGALDRINKKGMSVTLVLSSRQYELIRGCPNNVELSKQDFDKLFNEVGEHKAIRGWDVRNEPHTPSELSWVAEMLEYVKSVDTDHLTYVGLGASRTLQGDLERISLLEDVCAVHYYPWRGSDQFYGERWLRNNLPVDFKLFMSAVRRQNRKGLPVWIDETGAGSLYQKNSWNGYTSLKGQDYQYRLLFNKMIEFPEIEAVNFWQANKDGRFSVFNTDFTEKLCCEAIRQFYSGVMPRIPEMEYQ